MQEKIGKKKSYCHQTTKTKTIQKQTPPIGPNISAISRSTPQSSDVLPQKRGTLLLLDWKIDNSMNSSMVVWKMLMRNKRNCLLSSSEDNTDPNQRKWKHGQSKNKMVLKWQIHCYKRKGERERNSGHWQ